MAKPSFDALWTAFPDHTKYPTLKTLFTMIGGELERNINEPGFGPDGNTCAARISRALNYANHPIRYKTTKAYKLNPLLGADKKLYLFRVSEMRTYLLHTLGMTPKRIKSGFETAFAGSRGLVAFEISGWSDATGHIALWNGTKFHEEHDDYRGYKDDPTTPKVKEPNVKEMMLWEL